MATLALAGAGAAFGGLLTGGSALGLQAGWVLGQLGARALGLGVTEETREGPRIAEFRITNSSYNADLVTVDGAWRVDGHLIWLGAVREVAVTEEIGGKGGPSVSSTTYQYYADFAVAFCEAPPGGMAAILKMFAGVDAEPILDRSAGAGPIAVSADRGTVRIYLGTATQGPDPAIQAALGVADTPAYRGVCYAVFDNWRLQDAQLPPISAVVTTAASASFPTATLDPSQNALRWAELLPGGRGYINHAGDGLVIRIDLVNQAETAAADLPDFNNPVTNFPGIDGEGNFYNVTETGLNNWQLRKYDGLTFAQLGTTVTLTDPETGANIVSSVGWDEDRAFGGVRQLDGSYAGELLFIKENGGSNEVMVASTETLQNVAHYFLANGLGQGLAVDAERNLWAYSGNVAGDTVLYRIDPLTGGLSASFTVSGIVSNRIGHEPATNSLILGNLVGAGSSLARWEIETESLAGTLDGLTLEAAGNRNDSAFWNGASERGRLYLQTGGSGDFAEIDCIAMTLVTTWDNTDFGLGGDVEFALYDPTNHAVLGRDVITGDLVWRFLDRLVVGATTLRAVHERHAPRVGVAAAKLDAANLTETVNGLVMGGRAPLRRHLDPTQLAYFNDMIEEQRGDGYKIRFAKRGAAPAAAIPAADLGARALAPGAARRPRPAPEPEVRRADPSRLPYQVEVAYGDRLNDYLPGAQAAARRAEAVPQRWAQTVDLGALAFNAAEAAQIAERVLWLAYINDQDLEFTLGPKWRKLSAGDVVTVTGAAAVFTVLLKSIHDTATGLRRARAVVDAATVYTSTAAGTAPEGIPAPAIASTAASALIVADAPLGDDRLEGLVLQGFAGGFGAAAWPGAAIARSNDGVQFDPLDVAGASAAAAHGFATAALPDVANHGVLDRVSVLKVRLWAGTLASIAEGDLIADGTKNAFLLRSGAAWEWGNFLSAALQADGTWHLTTLRRGARNTENHSGAHAAGDTVVFPTRASLRRLEIAAGDLGVQRWLRAVTLGGAIQDAAIVTLTPQGRALEPYSPHAVRWSLAGGDYTVTAVRRTRLGGGVVTFGQVPLAEESASFELDVLSGGGAPVRTIANTNLSFTNPAAQQAPDSITAPFTVKIYQLSASVGRGEPATAVIG